MSFPGCSFLAVPSWLSCPANLARTVLSSIVLQNVELQNVENTKRRTTKRRLQNVESYKRANYKTLKVTKGKNNKRSNILKPNKRSKITKSRKRRENTVQYGKNLRKNFSTKNQKGDKKFPGLFLRVNSGLGWFVYGNHP